MANEKSIMEMYLNEIRKIPLMTREEENDLAKKAAAGDRDARAKIVRANLRFVVNIAKQYQNRGLEFSDLVNEGNIGLLNAIDRFDAGKGYHFISYAVWWIRQAIMKAICEKGRAIRLPQNKANELAQIENARRIIGHEKSEEKEIVEIGKMLGMETSHVREMLNISRDMISLDSEVTMKSDDSHQLGDFIEDTVSESPDAMAINNSMKEEISAVLNTLRPNEAKVLRLRYGLTGEKPMSLKEVGDVCNLTKERIRQIERRAIGRMQHPVRIAKLEAYVA
ncbi:MAG: RNA polymerase sigma factor RpoD/SigA [Treponema sp.]|nr:RNA polymerase sigma factor RpoD/SigA [Treponema sp.]